jgi:DNA-directed RNA polymerase subunit M/transcription elongation factor TFIIS
MSNYKFCPECSTFLHPIEKSPDDDVDGDSDIEEKGLYSKCNQCGHYEKTNTFSAIHFSKNTKKIKYINKARMTKDYVFDKRYKRTKQKECVNTSCSSRGKQNPEIVLITNNKQPEIGYLCTECNFIWGKF